MNIEKMLDGLTPEKLDAGLERLKGILSDEQISQIRKTLSNPNKEELKDNLKNVDMKQVKNNPEFKKFFQGK